VRPPAQSGRAGSTGLARYGIRLGLGVALIGWLAWSGDWRTMARHLGGLSPGWFGLAVGTYLLGQSLCAWKWSLLARTLGFQRPLRFFWVTYLGGMFASLFLPTSIGGDMFRTLTLARREGDSVGATVSVLADRGLGALAMVWIAALALTLDPGIRSLGAATSVIYALCGVLTVGFLMPFIVQPEIARLPFVRRVMACWSRPTTLVGALGIGFAFQCLAGLVYWMLGRALGVPVGPTFYFLLSPVVSIAELSPVTPNGVGERTVALVALFHLIGVGSEWAVGLGLAWTAMVLLAALGGGAVWLWKPEHAL
jgi:glycosyltransferase 2 family protein